MSPAWDVLCCVQLTLGFAWTCHNMAHAQCDAIQWLHGLQEELVSLQGHAQTRPARCLLSAGLQQGSLRAGSCCTLLTGPS